MSDPRPRVAIPWPQAPAAQQRLLRLLAGDLRQGPLDVVLLAPSSARGVATPAAPLPAAEAGSPAGIGPALEQAREAGRGSCRLACEPGAAEADARRLLGEGRIDALALAEAPQTPVPCLRVRDGVRVVDPWPELGLAALPESCDADRLTDALRQTGVLLRELGCQNPRVAVCALGDAPSIAAGTEGAQGQGLQVVGPLPARRAVRERCDALAALSPDQVALSLELLGSGPESVFPLDATQPIAWPEEGGDGTALFLTVSRVAQQARRPWAAEREQAKRTVSVTARASGRNEAPRADRCPYCHRALRDGDLAGPPTRCVTCGTGHHRDCLAEHGHCTVMGCPGTEVERLGVRVPIERLGPEEATLHGFESLEGDTSSGPLRLRVERPLDDPDVRTANLPRLALLLPTPDARRGEVVEGYVVVASPRPLQVRGGLLRLKSTLTTQRIDERGTRRIPRPQAILNRESILVGQTPAGALGRLQDGVVALFGTPSNRIEIPAGLRRWPFSFRLSADHPPSVSNRFKDTEETVTTHLQVTLDTETASLELKVR